MPTEQSTNQVVGASEVGLIFARYLLKKTWKAQTAVEKKRKEKIGGKIIGDDETFSILYRSGGSSSEKRKTSNAFQGECRIGNEEKP